MSEEQIRSYIIDKDSYDKNILVEAGAGAGKTRLIIQRVIGQIGAGIPVEKIVLIFMRCKFITAFSYSFFSSPLHFAIFSVSPACILS